MSVIITAPDQDNIWRDKQVPTPLELLGANLAAWFQSDSGGVSPWVNLAGNGDAIVEVGAPTVIANRFGNKPGVRFPAADTRSKVTMTTGIALGARPTCWCLFRLTQPTFPGGGTSTYLEPFTGVAGGLAVAADDPSAFPPDAFWDFACSGLTGPTDVFKEVKALDTEPHSWQLSMRAQSQLYFDEEVFEGAEPGAAFAGNQLMYIGSNQFGGGGFVEFGVIILSFDACTQAQEDLLRQYCRGYAKMRPA